MPPRRVLLLQLPVQSHDYEYSKENIPLALGYLKGFAEPFLHQTEILIVSPAIANYGGDAAIVDAIERQAPDVVGFGCAVWSVERTLHLCRRLKQRLPATLLVLGGPEVTADNGYLFGNGQFDFAVMGEGEVTFRDLLAALENGAHQLDRISGLACKQGTKWHFNPPRRPLEALDSIPSPYLQGHVAPSCLHTIALETVRGCPYRCAYCYYHKSYPKLRTFELRRIEAELRWAVDRGVQEVYFVDPCFARRPHLTELLGRLRAVNHDRKFRVQCELNAEDVSADLVRQLALAGVGQVEVGLQSTHPQTLRTIRRRFHPDAFINGIRMLRGMGIRVLVDLMVGLPGDALADVKRSIDFVVANDLCDDLKLYPLSVLPGTALRQRAREWGILHQERPPYLVLRTAHMSPADIAEAFHYGEQARGGDFFPPEVPLLDGGASENGPDRTFISRITIEPGASAPSAAAVDPGAIGQSLAIHIRDPHWQEKLPVLQRLLHPVLEANRFALVEWIIPEEFYPSRETVGTIAETFLWLEHPANREYFATHSPIRSTQVFILVRADGCSEPAVARIPLHEGDAQLEGLPFLASQRTCWVAFPREMTPEEEEECLAKLIRRFAGNPPAMRLADGPEGGFWGRRDAHLRVAAIRLD